VCSRGGFFDHAEVAGLQYILKANFAGKVFTAEDIEEARKFADKHFGGNPKCSITPAGRVFTRNTWSFAAAHQSCERRLSGWRAERHHHYENTDPEFYWLTNWAETLLLQSGIQSQSQPSAAQ